ncbi:acyltransferase [Fusobacterium nucleatum subsp. nucleatum ATCC 23726]|nr:acyltransferase [Fusobacterium nucleatum]
MYRVENIKGIDYAKAFAILGVLILHLYLPNLYDEKVLLRLWTEVGVPIFMIVTGHNYILSYYKSKENWLSRNNLYRKLKRIIIPYIYILIFEIILVFIKSDFVSYDFSKYRNIKSLFYLILIKGGIGPGSYYSPVLIQIVLIYFPLLLVFNKFLNKLIKNEYKNVISLLVIFIIEAMFEVIINYMGSIYNKNFIDNFYRMNALRYTPFLQLGIILYNHKNQILKNFKKILPLSIGGGVYTYLTHYKDCTFPPFYYWKQVATPIMFHALFFIYIALKYFNKSNENFFEKVIITIGKSTYHIFLVQMVYFGMLRIQPYDKGFYYLMHILICIGAGIIFYYAEPKITKKLELFIKRRVVV